MQTIQHKAEPLFNTINSYRQKYKQLIAKYPYLNRLITYFTVVLISLIWILFFNVPLLWRLGWLFDTLHTLAIFGLIIGVFGGLKPYLILSKPPKPYKRLVSPVKTKTYALKIHKAVNKLFYIISSLLSPSWWKKLVTIPSRISVSISLDQRNRIERLQDKIISKSSKDISFTETTYEALRLLNHKDYLIISIKKKPNSFIQYYKMTSHIRLELPLVSNKQNQYKLTQAIKFLKLKGVLEGYQIWNIQLNPNTYYFKEKWTDQANTVEGDLLAVMCKESYLQAVELGLGLLEKIHGWDKIQKLNYIANSFNNNWWSKL